MRGKKAKAIRKEFKFIVNNMDMEIPKFGRNPTTKAIFNPYQKFYRSRKQLYKGA